MGYKSGIPIAFCIHTKMILTGSQASGEIRKGNFKEWKLSSANARKQPKAK